MGEVGKGRKFKRDNNIFLAQGWHYLHSQGVNGPRVHWERDGGSSNSISHSDKLVVAGHKVRLAVDL